jgi:hypothetical protein
MKPSMSAMALPALGKLVGRSQGQGQVGREHATALFALGPILPPDLGDTLVQTPAIEDGCMDS